MLFRSVDEKANSRIIRTTVCRLAFAHVGAPRVSDKSPDKAGKFGANLLFLPGTDFSVLSGERGRLLAEIGTASVDFPVMLGVTTWLACMAHFLRTGAAVSLGGAALARLNLPTVLVQEGGYLSDLLGENLTAVLAGFDSAR